MKRNIKKHLSLLLAVLMLFTSLGFNTVFAADCNHVNDPNDKNCTKEVYPTCTEQGYTVYYCKNCNAEMYRGLYTDPLKHTLDEGVFLTDNNGASYYKEKSCTRTYRGEDNETKQCTYTERETEDGKEVVYYLVSFVNNRVPTEYLEDVNGVKLINTNGYTSETIAQFYVKADTAGDYKVVEPYLGKTKDFGEHLFDGWTKKDNLAVQAEYEPSVYASLTEPVKENTVYYPVFAGQQVEHRVAFFSLEGQTTNSQMVIHGNSPVYRVNGNPSGEIYPEPTKGEDLVNTYVFNGWSTDPNATKGISTLTVEGTPVYDSFNYYPTFKPVAKNYRVEFYTYDHRLIQAFDNINLETNLLANKTEISVENDDETVTTKKLCDWIADFNNVQYLAKPSNASFNYEWTGKWRVLRALGADGSETLGNFVDLKNFTLITSDDMFDKENRVIRLVPEYDDRLVVYHVGVKMLIPDGEDSDYYRGEAAVRVFDYNNQLVASGKTDANGEFTCKLNYMKDRPYTVKITTVDSKYLGESTISGSFQKDPNGNAYTEAMVLNVCNVSMTRNPEYETHCSCIHHNALLQPIWVRILNILYTFFNIRYECCYDMYSTIGPLLQYTKEG